MKITFYGILLTLLVFPATVSAASTSVVIGGSGLVSPPPFWRDSFLVGLVGTRQEAYPFHVIPGDGWLPESLEVPLYHYSGMAGSSATFSIWSDDSGHPGTQLATFPVSNITTEQRILSITPSYVSGPLLGNGDYWLVGVNSGVGQVNWNMLANTGDFTRAFRSDNGNWQIQNHLANMSAFAIKGSAVPEPSTIALLLTATIGGLLWWRRR
jgi:hypothetical protein